MPTLYITRLSTVWRSAEPPAVLPLLSYAGKRRTDVPIIKRINMIEVFDAKRTRSYGCFASFKAATDTLDSLAATGQLGSVPAVSVAAYCSGVLQRRVTTGI